jgi:hypothetical protein
MYLVINKWVIAVKVSNFSGQYLRNHWTLDIGVLGYIGIVWPKEHSSEVRSFPPGTLYIIVITFPRLPYVANICKSNNNSKNWPVNKRWKIFDLWHFQRHSVANWQKYPWLYLWTKACYPIWRSRSSSISPGKCFPYRLHSFLHTHYNVLFTPTLHKRSQWHRGLRHRTAAARLLELRVPIPPGIWVFFCCNCCVLYRYRPLRRADPSSRGVLPSVCHWGWPGAMITLFIYCEKTEEVGLRQFVLHAAANEQLGEGL